MRPFNQFLIIWDEIIHLKYGVYWQLNIFNNRSNQISDDNQILQLYQIIIWYNEKSIYSQFEFWYINSYLQFVVFLYISKFNICYRTDTFKLFNYSILYVIFWTLLSINLPINNFIPLKILKYFQFLIIHDEFFITRKNSYNKDFNL